MLFASLVLLLFPWCSTNLPGKNNRKRRSGNGKDILFRISSGSSFARTFAVAFLSVSGGRILLLTPPPAYLASAPIAEEKETRPTAGTVGSQHPAWSDRQFVLG